MHFPEDHIVSWISRLHIGMAAHGKQGVEGIRKVLNYLDRYMAGIRDALKKNALYNGRASNHNKP